jgi:hypothetical protein
LLLILAVVGVSTWLEHYRSTRWREPLFVAIYPMAADLSPVTSGYVDALDGSQFADIDAFFRREAARRRLGTAEPVRTRLRAQLREMPPQRAQGAGMMGTVVWSLELRYWAWRVSRRSHEPEDVRVFVLYHDPALSPTVPHSLGLSKGLIGVVYAFADPAMTGANEVIIAHELLHTLGATDKYDPANDAPLFPDGYGDPQQRPLFPQRYAELMAGRRMLEPNRWEQVSSLSDVVIGDATALEIRWPPHALPRAASTCPCSGPLVASTDLDWSVTGAPLKSVKRPPASDTIATQAAISSMFTSDSITASILPAASRW